MRTEPAHLASDDHEPRGVPALVRLASRVRLPRRLRPPWQVTFGLAVLGSAGLAVYLSDAAPTGLRAVDAAYIAGLAAVVAFFAATARRWTWFLPAGVGAVVAADSRAVLVAAAAVAVGLWCVLTDSRTPARAAAVAGAGVAVLLRSDPVGFQGATALLTAAAVVPVLVSGYQLAGRQVRHHTRRALLVGTGVLLLMLGGAAVGGASVANDLVDGTRLLDEGVVAARDADDQAAAQRLTQAARHLRSARSTLESWFVRPARGLPIVGPNLRAISRLADDTGEVAQLSSHAASSVDVDTLRFSRGRLDPELVGAVADGLEPVARSLERARASLEAVRSPWLVPQVSERMDRLEREVVENAPDVATAAEGARTAQFLLGGAQPQRYLVLFTTPTEARGRTGFPGNYAELVVIDGQITMPRFGRISELQEGGVPAHQRIITRPADYMSRYDRFDATGTWRNTTMSPDFPTIADVVMQLYPQSTGEQLSGVASIDPAGLAALMRFTGPIQPGEIEGLTVPLTADNVAQYLYLDQYRSFAGANDDRIDLLGDVAEIAFRRLTTGVDLPGADEVVDILAPAVEGGHIQLLSPYAIEYLDSIGLAGRFVDDPAQCDFLSVVNNNAGGNKLDQFLERHLRYDVEWDPAAGGFRGHVTATLHNAVTPADLSALPDYVVGNAVGLPRGTNRTFLSVYSCGSLTLDGALLNGQPVALQSEIELGTDVYSTFVDLPPGGTMILELDVHGPLTEPVYRLALAQQPLVRPEQAEVNITVAGDVPFRARGANVVTDDRTVRWAGVLDRERSFTVRAGN